MGHTKIAKNKIRIDLFMYFHQFLVVHFYGLLYTSLTSGDLPAVKFQKQKTRRLQQQNFEHTTLASVKAKQAVSHSLVPFIFQNKIKNPCSTNLYKFSQGGVLALNAQLPVLEALLTCKPLEFSGSKPLLLGHNALLP